MIPTVLMIVALVLAAMALVLLEILTPSFGVLSVLALSAMVAAVWLGFTLSEWLGIALILVAVLGSPPYIVWLVRVLPRTRLGRKVFLPDEGNRSVGDATPEVSAQAGLVGRQGVAETVLRPSGAIRIDGKRLVAMSEGGMIDKGTAVRVVRVQDMTLVVRRAGAEAPERPSPGPPQTP